MPLIEHYQFSPELGPAVRNSVAAVTADSRQKVLDFPGGMSLPNVCEFYDDFLAHHRLPAHDYHYVAYVHGDLNAANILVDAHHNVWVIDFFQAGPGHVLKDLAKFENDLLYLLTPIEDASQLLEALAITRALRSVADLQADLPGRPDELRSAQFVRAWKVLQVLREIGGQLCHEDRHPLQLQVALLRYAVHTLSFPEPSPLQAVGAGGGVLARRPDHPHRPSRAGPAGRLDRTRTSSGRAGSVSPRAPGGGIRAATWTRTWPSFAPRGPPGSCACVTDSELHWAGVPDLGPPGPGRRAHLPPSPIPDQGTPEIADAIDLARWCREATERGGRWW